jgi:hypothetical protein
MRARCRADTRDKKMSDVAFLALTIAMFALFGLVVWAVARL